MTTPDIEHGASLTHNNPPEPATAAGTASERKLSWPHRARAAVAVIAGRMAGALARRLRLGGGTSISGLVARRVDPAITAYLARQLRYGSIVITGTNGKTTTSGMVASVLRADGIRVWRNREGANLARGVTSALIIRARPHGRLRWQGNAAAVFEVDEAAFPQVVCEVQPRVGVVTNLFRDQLDRYGEVDTVAQRWRAALAALPPWAALVLNADDPTVAGLALSVSPATPIYFFGVERAPQSLEERAEADATEVVDSRTCPRCRAVLDFDRRFYSHVGHWRCPACGFARPRPHVAADDIVPDGLEAIQFTLRPPAGAFPVRIGLPGLYNVYNALAAATVGLAMDVSAAVAAPALAGFQPAFGRGERIAVGDRTVRLLLAKNPTGLNEVLRALAATGERQHLLLLLNDRAADGEDVSWIWDADFERVGAIAAEVTVGGLRAYDLALRLKYAGIPSAQIVPEIPQALDAALARTAPGGTLCVVPTYTALLAVRGELERRGYVRHYWE